MIDARTAVLSKIRKAIGAQQRAAAAEEYAAITRQYQQTSSLATAERVNLFASRILHYEGNVLRCEATALPHTIAQTVAARGKTQLHVPVDIDRAWLPVGVTFLSDKRVGSAELDRSEGVLTGCTVAIALTGTIVLTHARGEGRRAVTLVPDYYLSVVFGEQIVETVPEGMRRAARLSPALITTISGPSATADIEMTRIKGVHGPRTLDVIIVENVS